MTKRSTRDNSRIFREESLLNKKSFALLAAALFLPIYALAQQVSLLEYPIIIIPPAIASLFSFYMIFADKQKAKASSWRTPEFTLHISEILGGWPGSFIAQRHFRHKTSKAKYQLAFWMIVAFYQIASFDSLQDWAWTRQLKDHIQ